ncbi:flagellin, partial [Nocardioides sp. YIM 152588]|uniref:flagellin n=1 Tax=Nocardioides sp. YIM 152588 TaxID=3158259 RepID=UPI0032E3BBDA
GLRAQVGGLKVAVRNAQDGISVAQTAEGALTEVHSMLQRMNDLSVQYNSGTQDANSQAALSAEFNALLTEIDRIQTNTKFNGNTLFNDADLTFQVGYASGDTIVVDGAGSLKSFATIDTADFTATQTVGGSAVVITNSNSVQAAITGISTQRGALGAIQNRFEHTVNSVNVAIENLSASESRIRDTDMAQEMMNLTKNQILSQAGTAMLAQANSASQGVLQLLQG